MKDALALVKSGSYRPALTRYQAIYSASGEFAAGYNAAIMAEVLGEMNNAIALMGSLYDDTGNPKARTELERMRSTLSDAMIVEERYRDNDGHVAAVIRQVISELTTRVPGGAVLSILNTSSSEKQLTDFVVDGLTSNLVNNSQFAIIDRQNSRLIDAEKQFQMSGSVSDESAVSIGHELGVNTMVLCSIAGRSSLRRLTVRVIDVETARIVFQSSFDI
jgi:TolB-like protein